MATSTIVLSAPAKYDSATKEHSFTVTFNPPSNVAGKACYLKCVSIFPQFGQADGMDPLTTYLCGISFPQPLNYTNLNSNIPPSAAYGVSYKIINHQSDIVGAVSGSSIFQANVGGTVQQAFVSGAVGQYPRCLVHVPMYQNELKVRIFRVDGQPDRIDDLQNLTVIFELTPTSDETGLIISP